MSSLFGGWTADNKHNEQSHNMMDGSVPEVAAHTYEGAPSVDKSNGSDTLVLKKTREALFGSRTQQETTPAIRTFEEAASKLSQFTNAVPVPKSLENGGPVAQDETPSVRPTGVFVTDEGLVSGKRYADRPEGIDQFGAEEAERDPAFPAESERRLDAAAAASLARFKDQPKGLDQLGGEGSKSERSEGKGSVGL